MEYERNSNLRTGLYDLFFLEDLVLELEAFVNQPFPSLAGSLGGKPRFER